MGLTGDFTLKSIALRYGLKMGAQHVEPMGNEKKIQEFITRRDYDTASRMLSERLREDPENADTHYLCGVLNQFQGRIGQSIASLKRALDLDPQHTDAAICLSVLYNDIGKYEEAKKVFEVANQSVSRSAAYDGTQSGTRLGVDRKFAVKHLELGDLYFRYRRYDEAIDEYSKAINLDPKVLEIRIRRAKAYAKKGFLTRAIQELQQIKNEDPNCISARLQLGLLQFSQGNLLDAELEWEQILENSPGHEEAQSYLDMAKEARIRM